MTQALPITPTELADGPRDARRILGIRHLTPVQIASQMAGERISTSEMRCTGSPARRA